MILVLCDTAYVGLLRCQWKYSTNLRENTKHVSFTLSLRHQKHLFFESTVILEGYGLSEGTCCNSVNPLDGRPRKIGSIGMRK